MNKGVCASRDGRASACARPDTRHEAASYAYNCLPPCINVLQEEQEMLVLSEVSWAAIQRQGIDAGFWADQPPAMQWLRREMLQQMDA